VATEGVCEQVVEHIHEPRRVEVMQWGVGGSRKMRSYANYFYEEGTWQRSLLRRYGTSRKVVRSIRDAVIRFL
jgi:hypothetical protein